MKFVAIGDCHTGHRIRQDIDRLDLTYFWSSIVADILPDVTVVSRGGELTGWHGWWNKWQEYVLDEKPDVVVIFGGIYHFSFDKDPNPDIREIIKKMSESAKANAIVLVLCNMQPFKGAEFWTEGRQGFYDAFNAWLSEFCSFSGDIFIDAFKIFEEPGTLEIKEEFRTETKFHLNGFGQRLLGEVIAKSLAEIRRQ